MLQINGLKGVALQINGWKGGALSAVVFGGFLGFSLLIYLCVFLLFVCLFTY